LAIQKSQIANLKRFLEFARGGAIVHKEVVADYAGTFDDVVQINLI